MVKENVVELPEVYSRQRFLLYSMSYDGPMGSARCHSSGQSVEIIWHGFNPPRELQDEVESFIKGRLGF